MFCCSTYLGDKIAWACFPCIVCGCIIIKILLSFVAVVVLIVVACIAATGAVVLLLPVAVLVIKGLSCHPGIQHI